MENMLLISRPPSSCVFPFCNSEQLIFTHQVPVDRVVLGCTVKPFPSVAAPGCPSYSAVLSSDLFTRIFLKYIIIGFFHAQYPGYVLDAFVKASQIKHHIRIA